MTKLHPSGTINTLTMLFLLLSALPPPAIAQDIVPTAVNSTLGELRDRSALNDLGQIDWESLDFSPTTMAQDREESSPLLEPVNLRVYPRVGAGFITDGAGHEELGLFEAFVPLDQTVGETLTFLDGHISFGEEDNIGASLMLGYRGYNDAANRIRGGYIGLDWRDTGNSTFYQLGTGYESLGRDWDFRINGYFPLGDRSNVIRDVTLDSGVQTFTGFAGNQFVATNRREQLRFFEEELALGGFDAEAGYRVARWEQGDLTALGGIYAYSAPDLDTYLGWRLRLAANFSPNFQASVAVQDDRLFGSQVVLSMGATLPGSRPRGPLAEPDLVPARLGLSLDRQPELAVFVNADTDVTITETVEPLLNPEEEQPYRFWHVTLGTSGGDGTFENPFGTVAAALAATVGDGNDVVYIDGEIDTVIPGFTIPDRVQVLSQGPAQTIAALPFTGFDPGRVRLPFSPIVNFDNGVVVPLPLSGDGNFPQIADGVVLGNRTVLAGFRLDSTPGAAIAGSNIRNIELRNNTITNAGAQAMSFTNVGGSAVLFDNIVRNSARQGLLVQNSTTASGLSLAISGYEFDRNQVGLSLITQSAGGITNVPTQVVAIRPSDATLNTSSGNFNGETPSNAITNSVNEGILVQATGNGLTNATNQEISLIQGRISDSGSTGFRVTADNGGGSQEITITDSTIERSGGAGVEIRSGLANPFTTAYGQEIFIRNSRIQDNAASGVDIELNARGAQEITIDSSQILRNGGDGIRSVNRVSGLQEFPILTGQGAGISNNVIAGNTEQGIDVEVNDNATIAVLNVVGNRLDNNSGASDIDVRASSITNSACVVIQNNVVPSGIELHTVRIDAFRRATFLVQNRDALPSLNNGAPVQLINDRTATADNLAFSNEFNFCIP